MCIVQCAYPAVSCVWCNRSVHVKYFGGIFCSLTLICVRLLPICMRMTLLIAFLCVFTLILPHLMSSFRSFEIVFFIFAGIFSCSISEFDYSEWMEQEIVFKDKRKKKKWQKKWWKAIVWTNDINFEIRDYYSFIVFSHQKTRNNVLRSLLLHLLLLLLLFFLQKTKEVVVDE